MARIFLDGIEVYAFHGYYPEERKMGGKFRVDMEIEADTATAESSDQLKDTVNYEKLFELVLKEMKQPTHLLESVGKKIIDRTLSDFPQITYILLRIRKLNPPLQGNINSVGVVLEHKTS